MFVVLMQWIVKKKKLLVFLYARLNEKFDSSVTCISEFQKVVCFLWNLCFVFRRILKFD